MHCLQLSPVQTISSSIAFIHINFYLIQKCLACKAVLSSTVINRHIYNDCLIGVSDFRN